MSRDGGTPFARIARKTPAKVPSVWGPITHRAASSRSVMVQTRKEEEAKSRGRGKADLALQRIIGQFNRAVQRGQIQRETADQAIVHHAERLGVAVP